MWSLKTCKEINARKLSQQWLIKAYMFIAPTAFNQILVPGSVEISGVLTPDQS